MTLFRHRPAPAAQPQAASQLSAWLLACAVAMTVSAQAQAQASSPQAAQAKPVSSPVVSPVASAPDDCPALLNRSFARLQDDAPQSLCQYRGQVLLVVNTASYCGFTPQYKGLEALYAKYRAQGFTVLGFPSNDFGNQEPGNSKQIADFCTNTFGVKFPMFVKSHVTGDEANPLFAELTRLTGTHPRWNFYKYLIGRDGKVIDVYSSLSAPDSSSLAAAIDKALAQPQPAHASIEH